MNKTSSVTNPLLVAFTFFVLVSIVQAQAPATTPPSKASLSASQAVLQSWNEIGRKLIAMAEDFPEAKYDFKSTPAQRSFAEQLLHTAGSNDFFLDVARGRKPADDESRDHFKTKAEVVAYVKKSFAEGAAIIRSKGDAGLEERVVDAESGQQVRLYDVAYSQVEHCAEHYGQLVVYYRVAGLVPPESRPQK